MAEHVIRNCLFFTGMFLLLISSAMLFEIWAIMMTMGAVLLVAAIIKAIEEHEK